MRFNSIIVGAGIAGSVLARRLAEEKNQNVLIIEKKQFVGGYCHDYRNSDGILIHEFGPHIFRTNNSEIYKFLSRFTKWWDYQHKVLTYVEGQFLPMPINLDTINKYLGTRFNSENIGAYFEKVKTNPDNINSVKDSIESQVGISIYKTFFENYTIKQWGELPENLPKELVARIPIRANRDDRYFTAKYQAVPIEGYTVMINNMLNHPNIKIMLNTNYMEIAENLKSDEIYYSGSIDEYYKFCLGKLPYRCISFEFEELSQEYYQSVAVVNYPNNYDYTRITEFKHFTGKKCNSTVIAKEYSGSEGEPSYPIPTKINKELYKKYTLLENNNSVKFIGRLGTYQYYSMDQVVAEVLNMKL